MSTHRPEGAQWGDRERRWLDIVLRRTSVIAWVALVGMASYQLIAAAIDRNRFVNLAFLGALVGLSSIITVHDRRTPPTMHASARADPTLLVLIALSFSAFLGAILTGVVRADATLVLIPSAYAWWCTMRCWRHHAVALTIVFILSGAISVMTAALIALAPHAGPQARVYLITRAAEGCLATLGMVMLIFRRARRTVNDLAITADAVARRAGQVAAEAIDRSRRLERALAYEITTMAAIRRSGGGGFRAATTPPPPGEATGIEQFDREIDAWIGDELVELGGKILAAGHARGRRGLTVRFDDEARLDTALFVRRGDFEVLNRTLAEVVIPEPGPVECEVYADRDQVEARFLGEFLGGAPLNLNTGMDELCPGRRRISVVIPRAQASVNPPAVMSLTPPKPLAGVEGVQAVSSRLIGFVMVAQIIDVPLSLLQIAYSAGGISVIGWAVAILLIGLAVAHLMASRSHPDGAFASGAALRWLIQAATCIASGAVLGLGKIYLRGVGYPQPFARYLLFGLIIVILTSRVWPEGILAYAVAAGTLIACAALSGHIHLLVNVDDIRSVSVWPFWFGLTVIIAIIGKRSLWEIEDLSRALRDGITDAAIICEHQQWDQDEENHDKAFRRSCEMLEDRLTAVGVDPPHPFPPLRPATRALRPVEWDLVVEPAESTGNGAATEEHGDQWKTLVIQTAGMLNAAFEVTESLAAVTIRIAAPRADWDERLLELLNQYTSSCGGWLSIGAGLVATVPRSKKRSTGLM